MRNENSKIQIPTIHKGYKKRTIDALLSSLEADIVILNAGAGYGKTQALASYVRSFSGKSAWYSINETDNDLMSFILNFTKSVQYALGISNGDFTVSGPLLENIDIVMEQLVIWLDKRIDFLNIIFDDFQEITNPDIFNLLDILIETMKSKIRLFLVEKRALPSFFDKYIQSGEAVCLGMEELKFLPEEIASLLPPSNGSSMHWASLIYDFTEGWPVGIAQILQQLRQQKKAVTEETIQNICEKLEVSNYFMTKVYRMLPYSLQTFLKKTAVLDYMTPSICNKIAGIHNSDSLLCYLVNEMLFVQALGDGRSLYRYHSIFQRFLLSQTPLEEQQEALRSAAYFLLKTGDRIQAAEYACRGNAPDIIQAVLEFSGDHMLEERLYGTMERWFTFLETNRCPLTPKARFIYGKYLMALGRTGESLGQMELAGKAFYEEGRLKDYKKVLLFAAAVKRRSGDLKLAGAYLTQAGEYPENNWNEAAKSFCTEQIKLACCLHQLEDAAALLAEQAEKEICFPPGSFLAAAWQVLPGLISPGRQTQPDSAHIFPDHQTQPDSAHIFPDHQAQPDSGKISFADILGTDTIPEGFLLRNCILAEQMKSSYLAGDYSAAGHAAKSIIQNSEYDTLQTAIAWEMLALLTWEGGNYRKAIEQSRTGHSFLKKNRIWNPGFTPKHQQILNEIQSFYRNAPDACSLIPQKPEVESAAPKESGKIKIQCMGRFSVFLPDSPNQEMKWRTKKARELFAYLFHLQGSSVSREILVELLWPEAGMKSAIALFHTTLYSIRQSFGQEGLEDLISYEKKKYSLNMQLVDSDLKELTAYFKDETACTGNPEGVIPLYPGSYMGNNGYLWSYGMAKELENKYLNVLRTGAAMRTSQKLPDAAIPFFQRMLEADPYNEEILTRLISCLYKSGRQSEAKQQYDRMLKLYQEDLELEVKKTFKEIVSQEDL
ncbi:MAG: tetratricopeptide repeat protein [Lachnospiraceae bacterium]|nr:tetratricopeptide repeat protein [Lachnospiraceae bacterium]